MGLLYWMLGDIWQAPSKSSIEYGLKWKMSHYYAQHMYELVYPIAILKPYLANVTDVNATVSLYVVNELFNGIQSRLYCSILTLDTLTPRFTFSYGVSLNSPGTQHLADLPYATLMRDYECMTNNPCIIHCSFNSSQQEVGQTLFLTRPKNYQLYQPNLRIQSIQQVTANDFDITLNVTRPALFVWLDVPANVSGYFSRNGFHMFESTRTVSFHSWTPITNFDNVNFDLRITSLFDVIQP
jgi:beta-mannosidase